LPGIRDVMRALVMEFVTSQSVVKSWLDDIPLFAFTLFRKLPPTGHLKVDGTPHKQ